jgi:hypothetical protein
MSTPPLPATPGTQGFTLIETLVAMLTAILVMGALLAVLEFSLKQEARVADAVETNRISRTAMATITEDLHSSCTGFGAKSLQSPTLPKESGLSAPSSTSLWFLTAYSSSAGGEALVSPVFKHDIVWKETGKDSEGEPTGTLTDYYFEGTGTPPEWSFPELKASLAKKHVLAENVIVPAGTSLFSYYKYNKGASEATHGELESEAVSTESAIASAASKGEISKVTIAFTQGPADKQFSTLRTTPISASVVLRFENSLTGTETKDVACE